MLPLSECLAFSHVHVWPSLWLVVCPCLFPIRWSEEKIEEEKRRKRKDNKKENYSKFNKITIRVFCVFIWICKKEENARSEADRDQETADASDRIVSSVLLCLFFKNFHFSRERVKLGAVQIGSGKTPSPTDWRKGNQSVSEITDCGRPLWLYAEDRDTLRCEISFFLLLYLKRYGSLFKSFLGLYGGTKQQHIHKGRGREKRLALGHAAIKYRNQKKKGLVPSHGLWGGIVGCVSHLCVYIHTSKYPHGLKRWNLFQFLFRWNRIRLASFDSGPARHRRLSCLCVLEHSTSAPCQSLHCLLGHQD